MFKPIFGDKSDGVRYQGVVTARGAIRFEQKRARLAQLYKKVTGVSRATKDVSDGDMFDYLACGEEESIARIRKLFEAELAGAVKAGK